MHWLRILNPLGKIIASFGVLMMLPAVVSLLTADGMALLYVASGGVTVAVGGGMALATRRYLADLHTRHGFILVCLIWTLLPCFAALPLMFGLPDVSFTKGYFEATSGLTASGATVLRGLDDLPPSINFWRCEMSWLGGMGLIVLATAILPLLGVGGSSGFQTEMPGPMKDNRITPHIKQTAKALWIIYAVLTLLCALAYYAAGMHTLDALIHAFTTMGLGGFSSHDASYGYFDSVAIEMVAIFFMVIAGMNFALHYVFWRQSKFLPELAGAVPHPARQGEEAHYLLGRKWRERLLSREWRDCLPALHWRGGLPRLKMPAAYVLKKEWRAYLPAIEWRTYLLNIEWRVYLLLLALGVAAVFAFLLHKEVYDTPAQTLRYAAFNTISIITTTGYANTDFNLWPLFAPMLMLLMASFTSCSGSTGGGIKLIRALIAVKQAGSERQKLVHPSAYYANKIGLSLPQKILVSVLFFILAYITFAFLLMLFLLATGMDFITAFSAAAASISNTGPGLGEVGPAATYAHLADVQIWACAVAMLFGRLELMSFIVVMHRAFWKY